jgi:hypothetical protein
MSQVRFGAPRFLVRAMRAGPASTNVRHAVERGRPQLARMFAHTSRSFFSFGGPSPKRLAKSVSQPTSRRLSERHIFEPGPCARA